MKKLMLNKEMVFNLYGEYNVPFNIASKTECFSFDWVMPLEAIVKATREYMECGKESEQLKMDVLAVMKFGSLDIEMHYYELLEDNKIDAGFFVCVQREFHVYPNGYNSKDDDGWESYGFADLTFDIGMLYHEEELKELMYTAMMHLAEKDGLTWSKRNAIEESHNDDDDKSESVLSKQSVLELYGEYNVPYAVAIKTDGFDFGWTMPFEDIVKATKEYVESGKQGENLKLDTLAVMEFGSLDIELQYCDLLEGNKIDAGFFVCMQTEIQTFDNGYDNEEDNGWESYAFADIEFKPEMLEDEESLKRTMYDALMDVARRANLTWSKRN